MRDCPENRCAFSICAVCFATRVSCRFLFLDFCLSFLNMSLADNANISSEVFCASAHTGVRASTYTICTALWMCFPTSPYSPKDMFLLPQSILTPITHSVVMRGEGGCSTLGKEIHFDVYKRKQLLWVGEEETNTVLNQNSSCSIRRTRRKVGYMTQESVRISSSSIWKSELQSIAYGHGKKTSNWFVLDSITTLPHSLSSPESYGPKMFLFLPYYALCFHGLLTGSVFPFGQLYSWGSQSPFLHQHNLCLPHCWVNRTLVASGATLALPWSSTSSKYQNIWGFHQNYTQIKETNCPSLFSFPSPS